MVPGSGPSDRDNDVYFPMIRAGLLARGIAAASFDKRGVGESSGDWHDTGPDEQATDVAAQLACLRDTHGIDEAQLGLFGHSQGGWVALDVAAADPSVAFVVANSGPGVSPLRQERFALGAQMAAKDISADRIEEAMRRFDELTELIRSDATQADIEAFLAADDEAGTDLRQFAFWPADPRELDLIRRWADHDPRPALERITCPLLALFGGAERVVPVTESEAVYREAFARRPELLRIEILPGADHRLMVGTPPALHPAYASILADWIRGVMAV